MGEAKDVKLVQYLLAIPACLKSYFNERATLLLRPTNNLPRIKPNLIPKASHIKSNIVEVIFIIRSLAARKLVKVMFCYKYTLEFSGVSTVTL